MSGYGQHRHAAAMTIIEAIDEMEVARSATSGAYRKFASERRFRSDGKSGSLFISQPNPLHSILPPHRVPDTVERIARHSIDAPHTGACRSEDRRPAKDG